MENLHQLIGRLTTVFLPGVVRNQSFFINNVPDDLPIGNNPQWVASVVSRMISTAVNHVKNACIYLSARRHDHVVVLEIKQSRQCQWLCNGKRIATG